VAERADGWNTSGTFEFVRDALGTLQRHCDAVGRDIGSIEKTVSFHIIIRDDAKTADERTRELLAFNGVEADDFGGYLAGTPKEIAAELRRHLDLGFETVIVRMSAPYDHETIERMHEVADLLVT
jgi:alkanesulfonate monooxygenase SsuD/methylene tetrahydromethanopterin reductase-like flavin-dependent oxidoreductase (luciferase family)